LELFHSLQGSKILIFLFHLRFRTGFFGSSDRLIDLKRVIIDLIASIILVASGRTTEDIFLESGSNFRFFDQTSGCPTP
jgi:hypothetical protein